MSASLDTTSAEDLQGYVRTYNWDFLSRFFYGFFSAAFLTPYSDVAGKLTMTEMIIGDLIKRHAKTFDPVLGAVTFKPRELVVENAKIDLQIYPQEYYNSYLGAARKPGFNHDENPFEKFIMDKVFMKKDEEKEVAIWQGVKTGAPAAGDAFGIMFDGYLKMITDGLVAGDITAVATGAPALNTMVTQTESVYKGLPPALRTELVYVYMSVANSDLYHGLL